MTDTPTTTTPSAPAVETTTTTSPEVSKPLVTAKPYDDEIFNSYDSEPEGSEETSTEEQSSTEKSTETKVEAEKPVEPAKSKEGDKVDDGFESVPIKKMINGKEVEFKVKDAIEAYVKKEEFNRNMDKRITHISQREQAWNKDQANFKSKIDKVIEVAQKGDFVTGIKALAKLAAGGSSLNVTEFEKQYFDQLDKVREVYTKLSPAEREAYFAKRERDELKIRTKELEEEKTGNAQKSELEAHVGSLQKAHNLTDEEFWGNYKALETALVGEGKPFKSREEIQAEDVVKFSLRVRHEEKVLQAGQKLGIADDALLERVSRITATDPTLTVEDIAKVIKDAGIVNNANPQAVENLNRKAAKSKTQFNQANSTKKEDKANGYSKEEVDFLYRYQPKAYARPVR